MNSNFSFLELSVGRRKRYRVCGTFHCQIVGGYSPCLGGEKKVLFDVLCKEVINDEFEVLTIEGCHQLNPPVVDGASQVERSFGVKLPTDLHNFYREWGGGFLMLSEFHYILSPSEIVSKGLELRRLLNEPRDSIWNVIRFCDLGNGHWFALYNREGTWRVIFISSEEDDRAVLSNLLGPVEVYGESFSEWLANTIKGDGVFQGCPPSTPWREGEPLPYERLL